jgi:hypothetical protein
LEGAAASWRGVRSSLRSRRCGEEGGRGEQGGRREGEGKPAAGGAAVGGRPAAGGPAAAAGGREPLAAVAVCGEDLNLI